MHRAFCGAWCRCSWLHLVLQGRCIPVLVGFAAIWTGKVGYALESISSGIWTACESVKRVSMSMSNIAAVGFYDLCYGRTYAFLKEDRSTRWFRPRMRWTEGGEAGEECITLCRIMQWLTTCTYARCHIPQDVGLCWCLYVRAMFLESCGLAREIPRGGRSLTCPRSCYIYPGTLKGLQQVYFIILVV